MSYAGLVLDLDRSQRREQLLDEVVLLVVEGGTAELGECHRPPQRLAVLVALFPVLVAGALDPLRNHVHGAGERDRLPRRPVGPPVERPMLPMRAGHELEGGRTLGAQTAARDGGVRIALDVG